MQIPVKQHHRVIRYLQTQYVEYDSKNRININITLTFEQCTLNSCKAAYLKLVTIGSVHHSLGI